MEMERKKQGNKKAPDNVTRKSLTWLEHRVLANPKKHAGKKIALHQTCRMDKFKNKMIC